VQSQVATSEKGRAEAVEGRQAAQKDRDVVAQTVLERAVSFMHANVAEPLRDGLADDDAALRAAAQFAAEAVEDLEFFARQVADEPQVSNIVALAQHVAREFSADWDIPVRMSSPSGILRSQVAAESLKDSLYLLLSNAGHFGEGKSVDLVLETEGDVHRIFIRDQGEGFSQEALARGLDPFYSTRAGALGLGLSRAREVVTQSGGELWLRNGPEGGGEVEITFPVASR